MLGEIPNPSSTGNSIVPTVANGSQSVKRDEKAGQAEPNGVTPASKCPWVDNEQALNHRNMEQANVGYKA